jgi:hypothetical protein
VHSSISSSDPSCVDAVPFHERGERTGLDRFTIVLLATILGVLGVTEAVTVIAFDRTSKVQQREVAQRRALLSVSDSATQDTPHVAVLGNSLMLDGTDVPLLASKIEPRFVPVPYFVLGTEYFDWYFGLKRLFAEGVRPRYVVLGLSPNQFASFYTRGNYSARYLFQRTDLLEVARKTHMDPTTASEFVLSHFSKFFSTRDVTRGFIMTRLLPSVAAFLHNSRPGNNRQPSMDQALLRQLGPERIVALDHLCRVNGSQFMLVIPPTYERGAETIAEIGKTLGVRVLVPVNEELGPSYYQIDGFHLSQKGAEIFTRRLAEALLNEASE